MSLRVVFRADASRQIGTGHVMRCLTLARRLRANGAQCRFVCREHEGHLVEFIRAEGFLVHPLVGTTRKAPEGGLAHAAWLGVSQVEDARQTREALGEDIPDWLVVDHYGLDARWEALIPARAKLVIDDLADRTHQCDLLLDQTLGRAAADYQDLVPPGCRVLAGSSYALLRPEFAEMREASLQRRAGAELRQILVTMGGVDQFNVTETVLDVLDACPALEPGCRISVVMGSTAQWLDAVRARAAVMRLPTEVAVGVSDMAARMAASDLAIGAAGSTSWERCCLGLPTAMVVLADNQVPSASALREAGAARLVGGPADVGEQLPGVLAAFSNSEVLRQAVQAASEVCDGQGVQRLVSLMEAFLTQEQNGDRVRRMREDDLALVLSWRNHPEIRKYMYTTHEIGLAEHTAWFSHASQNPAKHLLIFETDGVPAGFSNLSVQASGGVADWGFYIAPDAPRGMGRRLGKAVLDYAFGPAALHKVAGQALAFNERSIKFHEGLGFVREGVLRDQHFDGERYHSIVAFGMLRHEWHSL